jgi:hypothetical protein
MATSATNVIIDNWIDYSTQLNELSSIATYLSELPSIATNIASLASDFATFKNSIINIEADIDTIRSHLASVPFISNGMNSLTNATQSLSAPISRISTVTEALFIPINKLSSATEVISTTTMKLATTASMSLKYSQDKDQVDNYFSYEKINVIPETISAGEWNGVTTSISLINSTNNSDIVIGYRVEGNNIDLDTFVSNINLTTKILTISRATLGSSKGKNKLSFFAT